MSKKKNTNPNAWPKSDIKILKEKFPNWPTKDVADLLGRPLEAVKKYASRHGLRKSPRYLKSIGRVP